MLTKESLDRVYMLGDWFNRKGLPKLTPRQQADIWVEDVIQFAHFRRAWHELDRRSGR